MFVIVKLLRNGPSIATVVEWFSPPVKLLIAL